MLHLKTLSPVALDLVRALCSHPAMQSFALAGGTSLALRFGHRISVDLDFFTHERFDNEALTAALKRDFPLDERRRGPSGVTGFVTGVKVDLVHYPHGHIQPTESCDGIRLVSLPDVVAMKLSAITNRGAKKDFYDLHTLIEQFGLGRLIDHYRTKFPGTDPLMLLRSVTYFADAESDEPPATLVGVTWIEVKRSISKAAQTELAP
jgi:hypothetical protein